MKKLATQLLGLEENDFSCDVILQVLRDSQISEDDIVSISTFSEKTYTRNLICKNDYFEMLVLCWEPGQETMIHDHSSQSCWMTVLDGIITSENYAYVAPSNFKGVLEKESCSSFKTGQSYYIDDGISLHRLRNPVKNKKRATTLHIYSKPFDSCSVYDLEKRKVETLPLRYHSVAGVAVEKLSSEITVYPLIQSEWRLKKSR